MNNTKVYGWICPSTLNNTALKIGGTIAGCLIFVVSLVGNSFIALIVYKTQRMRKPINYFITNMAISDMLYPVLVFPMTMTEGVLSSRPVNGPLGQAWCKLFPFLPFVSAAVSVQSLLLIAVDRFGAVVFPLRSPLVSPKLCPLFILASWIVAVAVVSPYLFAFRLVEYQGMLLCQQQWKEAFKGSFYLKKFTFSLHVTLINISFTMLIIFYSVILVKLNIQLYPGEQSVNAKEQRARRNRNVLKMVIAIVFGFAVCFLPWGIFKILRFVFAWDSRIPHCDLWTIFWFMAASNCAINPSICFIFSGNYRQGLKRLLKCFRRFYQLS